MRSQTRAYTLHALAAHMHAHCARRRVACPAHLQPRQQPPHMIGITHQMGHGGRPILLRPQRLRTTAASTVAAAANAAGGRPGRGARAARRAARAARATAPSEGR